MSLSEYQNLQRGADAAERDPFEPDPSALDAEATDALRRISGAGSDDDEGDRIAAELVAARLQALGVAASCTAEMSLSMVVDRVRRAAYLDDLEGLATDAQIVAEAERIQSSFSDNRRTPDWRQIATTRAAGDLAVTTDESGVVVDARPAEMTPDRGPDVGVTHHTLTDAYADDGPRWSGSGASDDQAISALIPSDRDFNGKPYREASELAALASDLIEKHGYLDHLENCEIRYFWKRKTGSSGRQRVLGGVQRGSGLLGHLLKADFAIFLAADTARERKHADRRVERSLFRQLRRIGADDKGNWIMLPYSLQLFGEEIQEYADLDDEDLKVGRNAYRNAEQMGLFREEDDDEGQTIVDDGAGILIHDDGTPMTAEEIAEQEARELADDDIGCEACGGTGGQYTHAANCDSEFCVGNGDAHSCSGSWGPCGCNDTPLVDDSSGLDCRECGGPLDLEHFSSDRGLCRPCQQAERDERDDDAPADLTDLPI